MGPGGARAGGAGSCDACDELSCEPLREARDEPRRVKESAYFVIVLKAIRSIDVFFVRSEYF